MPRVNRLKRTRKFGIRRSRKPEPRFDIRAASERSLQILFQPPARPHLVRVEPVGTLVERFLLPLSLCQPQNRTRHASGWKLGKLKKDCLTLMFSQLVTRRTSPLGGRPQVLCVRFSSVEPDKYNDGFKIAIDCLVKLGLIVDDAPKHIDLHQVWELAPPKQGMGLIEVWTGNPKAAA